MSSYMSSLPFGVAMQSASERNQHNDLNSAKIKLKEFSQKKKKNKYNELYCWPLHCEKLQFNGM